MMLISYQYSLNIYMSKLVLLIMDKTLENLISSLAGLVIGYSIAEGYKQFVSHSAKKSWEDDIGIHHGEAGIALFGAGSVSSAFLYVEENQKALNASLFATGSWCWTCHP